MVATHLLLRHRAVEEGADVVWLPFESEKEKSEGGLRKEEKAEQKKKKIKDCRSGVMEKGEKAKGRLVGEMRRWLSSGSERPRILAFSALGMEVPDNSGGAAHFPVRR